jgi:hypothetical protein
MRIIKFRFYKNNKLVGEQELKPSGIIDMAYEWDHACQFTGLLDRLGKEIYEGDICRFDVREGGVGEPAYHNLVGQVGFSFGCYTIGDFLSHYHSLEVIGNIYENPNLLEGKDG